MSTQTAMVTIPRLYKGIYWFSVRVSLSCLDILENHAALGWVIFSILLGVILVVPEMSLTSVTP